MAAIPIRVLRGEADFTGSPVPGSVIVSLGTTIDTTRAFVRVTGTLHSSGGATAGQASATTMREFSVRAILGPDVVRIVRPAELLTSEILVFFEVWEYIGAPGGEHEFRVAAGPLQTTIPDGSFQAQVGIDLPSGFDMARCVPIMMAQMCSFDDTTVSSLHVALSRTAQVIIDTGPSGTVVLDRGSSIGIATVSWVLVEFTGSAWSVRDTIVAFPGASYDLGEVVDFTKALLFSTFLTASDGTGPSSYTLWPAADQTNSLILTQAQASGIPGAERCVAYLVQNDALEVYHANWNNQSDMILPVGTAGTPQTITRTDAQLGFRSMVTDRTGIIGTAAVFGTTEESPRQHMLYRIASPTSIEFFRGYAGGSSTILGSVQIVYFQPESTSLDEPVAIEESWTAFDVQVIAFADLGRIAEFVEAGTDEAGNAYQATEPATIFDQWAPFVTSGPVEPPPPTSDVDFLRANWAAAVAIDTAEVTDVSRAGSSSLEERLGLLDRPRRTIRVLLTGMDDAKSAAFRLNMTRATQGDFDLPVYSDLATVTAASSGTTLNVPTANRRFVVGGRVIVHAWDAQREPTAAQVRTIAAVGASTLTLTEALTGSFPALSRAYPLARCKPALGVPLVTVTDGVVQIEFEAREAEGPSTIPARALPEGVPTYRGWPIVTARPNWRDAPSLEIGREVEQEQVGASTFDRFLSEGTAVNGSLGFTFTSRAAAWQTLSVLESRRGRALPFWILGPQSAGKVVAISAGGVTIAGQFDLGNVAKTYPFVGILLRTGEVLLAKLAQATAPAAGQILLSFEEDLDAIPAVEDIRRVSSAHLVRMASDVFTETWATDEICEARLEVEDTQGEPDEVQTASFTEAGSVSDGVIESTEDLWVYLDSTANTLRATTIANADFTDPANGDIVSSELWPRVGSDVHFWADVRWSTDTTLALRHLTSTNAVIAQPVLQLVRTVADSTLPTASTAGTSLGAPSVARQGSLVHRLIFAESLTNDLSGVPWGDSGATFFLHLNTPPSILDPTSGSLDVFSYLGNSGGPTTWFTLQLGRTRMIANEVSGPNPTPGFSAQYADLYDGTRKLIVYRIELGGEQRLYVDGELIASTGCPPFLGSVDNGQTRWLRWMGFSAGSSTDGVSQKVGTQLQANAIVVVSRPLPSSEINAIGQALADRHGTLWTEVP